MKSILISIKPKYVAKILNGEKTIEIRKTMPKCDLPIQVYIYCTKESLWFVGVPRSGNYTLISGKVVAKFTMYGCLPMKPKNIKNWKTQLGNACLTEEEYLEYSKGKDTYQWVIDDLEIFDRPKELSEFKQPRDSYGKVNWNSKDYYYTELTKAPESWQFIESED